VPTELLRLPTALIVSFTDAATGLVVRDGLRVVARLRGDARALVRSLDGAGWSLHLDRAAPASVALRVDDPEGRYLPVETEPATGGAPARFELASAPGRSVPPGYAVVRAEIRKRSTGAPMPGSRLEITCDGHTARGHADATGQALVLLPWPKAPAGIAGTTPLLDRTWACDVKVAEPDTAPPAGPAFALDPDVPFTARRAFAEKTGLTALPDQTLRFGASLVLHTESDPALLVA
jgi:hypothetical protein